MKGLLDALMEESVQALEQWTRKTGDPLLASQAVLTVLVNVLGNYAASARDPVETIEQLRAKSLDATLHYLVQTARQDSGVIAAKLMTLGAVVVRARLN